MALHSTGIRLALAHCPAALDFHERRTPVVDRRFFETGIAAHAVLEAVGHATEEAGRELEVPEIEAVGLSVSKALITEGREYDGHPEPPLHPDSVFEGRELAEAWLSVHPLVPGESHPARYEVGLAVNAKWEPVPYDSPDAWLACIVDLSVVEDELSEEGETRVLRVRDYKSAWSAGPDDLNTLQRKIQAVLTKICMPEAREADLLRLEVAAVRTWKVYTDEVFLRHGGLQKIERWRQEIDLVANELGALAVVNHGARPARPGAGCVGCPYVLQCEAAQLYFGATRLPQDPKERAKALCIAVAMVDEMMPTVKEAADGYRITLDNGDTVGWRSRPARTVTDEAHQTLAQLWAEQGGSPESAGLISGLLKAVKFKSVTAVEDALKVIFPTVEEYAIREGYLQGMVQETKKREWTYEPKENKS